MSGIAAQHTLVKENRRNIRQIHQTEGIFETDMRLNTPATIRLLLLTILVLSVCSTKGVANKPADTAGYYLLKTEKGNTINIAAFKGKVLFLNFWALSCVPCKTEMPTINELQKRFIKDTNIIILPIDLDNELPEANRYMQNNGFTLTVYNGASPVPQALFRGEIPTTVVIDKQGRIVLFKEGADDYSSKAFIDYVSGLSRE